MTTARQQLVAMIDVVLTEWEAGQTYWVGGSQKTKELDPDYVVVDPLDSDVRSLRAAKEFLIYFIHEMNHSDPNFDGLAWDEAVVVLKETGTRLRNELPIEDTRVLRYMREPRTPEQVVLDNKIIRGRLLGVVYCLASVTAGCVAIYRGISFEGWLSFFFGILAVWHFAQSESQSRVTETKNDRR